MKLEQGNAVPPPVGFCTFDHEYPYETFGIEEQVRFAVRTTGLQNPLLTWNVHGHVISGPPGATSR